MMNNLNIIVDGNYLFYKSLFVAKGYGDQYNEKKKFLDNKKQAEQLVRKAATDLVYTLNEFDGYKRVIFTKDTKSWRKQVDVGYKSTRTQSDDINWKVFYKCMDEFLEILKDNGVIISSIPTAEGDDLMALWAEYFNTKDNPESCVVLTGDGDLPQIVKINDNRTFTVIFVNNSKNKKIIAPNGFKEWIYSSIKEPINIFDSESLNRMITKDAIDLIKDSTTKHKVDEIDAKKVSLQKILCGDDGDAVPSVWEWKSKTGKKVRITNKYLTKVYDFLIKQYGEVDIDALLENKSYRNRIRVILQEISKVNIPSDEFEKNIKRNTTLTYLFKEFFPKSIVEEFDDTKDHLVKKSKPACLDKNTLLEGTRFEFKEQSVTTNIFKMM